MQKFNKTTIYFVGPISNDVIDIVSTREANILISQMDNKGKRRIKPIENLIAYKKANPTHKIKIIIDSGAFSVYKSGGKVNTDEYINFINGIIGDIDYYVQNDKIPGTINKKPSQYLCKQAEKWTWNDFLYMESKSKDPYKLLPVYHYRDNIRLLEKILTHRRPDGTLIDYICIAPLKEKGKHRLNCPWLKRVHKKILELNPNVKVHALGFMQLKLIIENTWLTSADATSCDLSAGYGSLMTPYGQVKTSAKALENKDPKKSREHILNKPKKLPFVKEYVDDFQFLKVKGHPFYDSEFAKCNIPTWEEVLLKDSRGRTILNCLYLKLFEQNHPLIQKHIKLASW